ncbi:MAG: hypothetical protein UT11_C0017G0010 [Berkelbacteria bacterium GW2011_GWA2_38_9]|uniref:Uncharacterized protein n=1 Tax=Berkelbacteria bacterium GW2011_GWA2_38_9 TaxID=1618334 RepID=A0A0G0LFN4_9BACT|nr:MAG: hypothetical protein UT11_C0017G0010 [Berkelbacteria bacterium GW2011_GWA2_38_9]
MAAKIATQAQLNSELFCYGIKKDQWRCIFLILSGELFNIIEQFSITLHRSSSFCHFQLA